MPRRLCLLPDTLSGALLLIALVAAPSQSAPPEDPLRLDDTVVPTAQSIELWLDPAAAGYHGRVEIALRVNEPVDRFRLHAQEMDLQTIRLSGAGGEWELGAETGETHLQTLHAPATLEPGAYTLRIEFANDYDLRAQSLYKLTSEGHDYLYTQFEAIDARGAFPCFDEPRFKISWAVTLHTPDELLAFSNAPVAEETAEDGWVRRRFEETPPMPSYLVALAVGPFETVPVADSKVPLRVITPSGKAALAHQAATVAGPLLQALEDYFGMPYPYAKLDLIAVPEFWPGAMENAGLITFRDALLLLEDDAVTVGQKRRLAAVTAHEMAHLWFGDLVTMQWWDDLWLNESFATWLGNKITDQVFPEFGLAATNVEATERAKFTDSRRTTKAMRAPVPADAIESSMDPGITYQKGEAVLSMFESFVGEERFQEGVRSYIREHAWKNTVAADFLGALDQATGVDVSSAMSTFLDQPGVPEVRATVLGDGRVEFAQSRFTNVGFEPEEETLWRIPVVFRYSDGEQVRTQRVLLDEPTQVVELPGGIDPEWIHPNADERGYYRWRLDPEQLFDLVGRSAEVLNLRERIALVSQLSAQLDAGRIGGGDYLRAAGILAQDPAPEVLDAALSSLTKVRFAFVTADEIEPFRRYVRAICGPALARIGLEPRADEAEAVALLRPQLLSWLGQWGEDTEVIDYAHRVAEAYLADRKSVDPSIAGTCLAIAARDGGWKLFNAYKKAFEEATVPADRQRFLSALGSFGDRTIQDAALRYALQGPTRPQELFAIPQAVAEQSIDDPDRMWNWFTGHYDAIAAKVPEMFRAYLPYFATSCEESRLQAAREFFALPEHHTDGQEVHLARVAETTLQCVELRQREGQSVRAFLDEYRGGD